MSDPDLKQVITIGEMSGDDEKDSALLNEMLGRAINYLSSQSWCPEITEKYFGFGIGGVVAVFLFRLSKRINGTDEFLWVIVGDLPSAYLVGDRARDPKSALEVYCELMEGWVEAVMKGDSLNEVYPVNVQPTSQYAEQLRSRIQFLKDKIIPMCGE
jgi:hypothetical protein